MDKFINEFPTIAAGISAAASLLSAVVAICALIAAKRTAWKEAVYSKKTVAYGDFLAAFSAVCFNPADRDALDNLTQRFYIAAMYATDGLRKKMLEYYDRVCHVRTAEAASIVDADIQKLYYYLHTDLQSTWKNPKRKNKRARYGISRKEYRQFLK